MWDRDCTIGTLVRVDNVWDNDGPELALVGLEGVIIDIDQEPECSRPYRVTTEAGTEWFFSDELEEVLA